jgi:polar amino acid transport system substrate-binding protein
MRLLFTIFAFLISFIDISSNQNGVEIIKNRKKIIVGMVNETNIPFYMLDDSGEIVGYDVLMAKKLAKKLGVELDLRNNFKTYEDVIKAVNNKQIDVGISALSKSLKRAEIVSFTDSYTILRQGLAANRLVLAEQTKKESIIEKLQEQKLPIAIWQGASYFDFANEFFKKEKIIELSTWTKSLDAVRKKDVAAVLTDEFYIEKFLLNHPASALEIETIIIADLFDEISMAVSYDNNHLLYYLNFFIQEENLKISAIDLFHKYKKYFYEKK